MPFNPFSALTSKIFGGAALALLIALGVVMWRADVISGQRDALRDKLAVSDAKLALSNASIATLEKSLADYVGAGKAAKVAQLAAVEKAAKDNAALQGQADAIRKEVAGMKPDGKCATPKAVRSAKGL
jgi:hypothetical protein